MTIRAFSYGGGVQSTAALVLAARGEIDYPVFIFAHVGEKSENPLTLTYIEEWARPYAGRHGIEMVEVRKTLRDGSEDDLWDRILRTDRSVPFPARRGRDGAPGQRSCTSEFKVRPISAELRRRGATEDVPAIVGIGITVDEIHRAKGDGKPDPRNPEQIRSYPLLDLRLRRFDCHAIILSAGLPIPPKSSCFFCPFHGIEAWRRLKRDQPVEFSRAEELEKTKNEQLARHGKPPVWLTRYGAPLAVVVQDQTAFDYPDLAESGAIDALYRDGDLDNCESGYCLT